MTCGRNFLGQIHGGKFTHVKLILSFKKLVILCLAVFGREILGGTSKIIKLVMMGSQRDIRTHPGTKFQDVYKYIFT